MSDWIKAACQVRITKATFDFSQGSWEVEGYLDFLGPGGMELIGGKMFKHSWFGDNEVRDLRKIIENKVGVDLFEQEEMWNTLSNSDQQNRVNEMERVRKRKEAAQ